MDQVIKRRLGLDGSMSKESVCVRVPKIHAQKAVILANNLEIVNNELKIQRNNDSIYIPLIRRPKETELETFKKQVPGSKFSTHVFPERKRRAETLVEVLEDKLPPHLLASLPHSMDFVGEIAVLEIPPELDEYKSLVGEAVLKMHKNVRTVLNKRTAVRGTYRLRGFDVIAGEPKTETVHKEYGCRYHVDLSKVYFSPRLSYEHNRVASLVQEGETVVDLFTGVGPFAILIAKTHEDVEVYAIDVNPDAVKFLKENVILNRVTSRVHPILGDARKIVRKKLSGVADRVIMNLPEKAIQFVDAACEAIKPTGGMVHFYSFVTASKTLEDVKVQFVNAVEKSGRKVEEISFSRHVRTTAPYEWQAVLDARIH